MKKFGTKECVTLYQTLSSRPELQLTNTGVQSVRPLSLLKNVKVLLIAKNNVSDLESLSEMPLLRGLEFTFNLKTKSNPNTKVLQKLAWISVD